MLNLLLHSLFVSLFFLLSLIFLNLFSKLLLKSFLFLLLFKFLVHINFCHYTRTKSNISFGLLLKLRRNIFLIKMRWKLLNRGHKWLGIVVSRNIWISFSRVWFCFSNRRFLTHLFFQCSCIFLFLSNFILFSIFMQRTKEIMLLNSLLWRDWDFRSLETLRAMSLRYV